MQNNKDTEVTGCYKVNEYILLLGLMGDLNYNIQTSNTFSNLPIVSTVL